jgi:hypothetical protein
MINYHQLFRKNEKTIYEKSVQLYRHFYRFLKSNEFDWKSGNFKLLHDGIMM